MSINRRLFLKSSCGAVVAVVASQTLFSQFFTDSDSLTALVKTTLKKRFPNFNFDATELDKFAAMMAKKDLSSAGTSGNSLAEILDDKQDTITFERYVTREFMLNSNYLSHKSPGYPGLKFIPFAEQQASIG